MEKDLSIQEFISFLKNHKVYKEFRKNLLLHYENKPIKELLKKALIGRFSERTLETNYDYLYFLSDSFEWEMTREGWDFWYDVKSRFFAKYF